MMQPADRLLQVACVPKSRPTDDRKQGMKSDADLNAALETSLSAMLGSHQWPLELVVDHGMVTVSGQVDTQHTRFQIERAVRRVDGLRSLQINIRPAGANTPTSHGPWVSPSCSINCRVAF